MSVDRELLITQAKFAEEAERYPDMAAAMKSLAELGEQLSDEERNLLSLAYKNVVGNRRAGWRIMHAIEQRETSEDKLQIVKEYKNRIEDELKADCNEVLNLLDNSLIPKAVTDESMTFYLKMKGDYWRYLAEIASEAAEKQEAVEKSEESYQAATGIANEKLPPTHPIRLGLALNVSVFFYDILDDPEKACTHAKKAFDDAVEELDNVPEDSFKDTTLLMQLLRDNIMLWADTVDPEENAEDGDTN